jgi:ATP-binding cassette subfamily B protein
MKNIHYLWAYIKRERWHLIYAMFLAIIASLSTVLIPYFSGKCLDIIAEYMLSPSLELSASSTSSLMRYLYLMLVAIAISAAFNYLFDASISISVERMSKQMKDDVYAKMMKVDISYIDTHSHGDLVSRCINDVDYVSIGLMGGFKQFFLGIITVSVTIIFMFYVNRILGFAVLFLTPISFFISYKVAKRTDRYFKKQAAVQGEIGGEVLESFSNMDIVKSFGAEKIKEEEFFSSNNTLYGVGWRAQFAGALTNPSTRLINNSTYGIVGVIGALLTVYAYPNGGYILGALCSIGVISTFLQYANQFAKPFNEMAGVFSDIQQGFTSFSRIVEVLEVPDEMDDGKLKLGDNITELSAEHVYFSYSPSRPLIRDFNIKIKKGMKVALVGPTGCGKTTMINLLLRFYDPDKGRFTYDGISGMDLKKSDIRRNFGMVLQDTRIFKGTVYENIAYIKPEATKEEVEKAAKDANAYEFIMRLPQGFDTPISDDSGLSSGEKQLITIARVMLDLPDTVILDEATSSVDTRSEVKITEAFSRITKGRTSIVIAHRLSTIVSSDLIVVMKDGQIVEMGKHRELLAKKGFYYELFNAQFEVV